MKIAVIGGGSTYTPELVSGFLARARELGIDELWLMDSDPERLEVVGGFARRMVEAAGAPFLVALTTDRRQALAGASYVTTQLRVGGMAARRSDEYLGRRHGLIGQETTGVGGMAKALRTIPVVLSIAQEMGEVAEPGAVLANFTNPAGLITQALALHAPRIGAVGVCNVPITAKMMLLDRLERITGRRADPAHAQLDTLGLNHLSWHRGLTVDGCDVWPLVLGDLAAELEASEDPEWDPSELARTGLLPNHYLQYYYRTRRKLAEQDNWPPSRAEQVVAVEAALMERYDDPALSVPPAELMQRGGAWYSTAATQLLAAHHLDAGEIHVANVRNAGAVRAWPEEWVLELPCRVDRQGITPLPAPPLPEEQTALLRRVKAYELLVVEAAVRSDRNAAREALTAHPLGPAEVDADDVLSDLLATNRPFLPGFWE